ncbi:hypothetical protein K3181_13395 [Qipengyuania sp. YG27]|uniref:Uncharacterized protein n=1 Tax=Qipengyuania mesophila TaxID=2867246 RepID=A0ABS7JXW1_9SPHN|nr:hypothetical protein [Qipengyuania mesophila]MBX7502437.1 hypothetical protein [Qipengyuania mesophila]
MNKPRGEHRNRAGSILTEQSLRARQPMLRVFDGLVGNSAPLASATIFSENLKIGVTRFSGISRFCQ